MKDVPLSEITIRRYEKPRKLKLRELIKRLCLSLGLLNPGDSRDIIVDILFLFITSKKKKEMELAEIERRVYRIRKMNKQPLIGISTSNILRQLRKLKNLYIIEKFNNKYRLCENLSLTEIIDKKVIPLLITPSLERLKEYCKEIEKRL